MLDEAFFDGAGEFEEFLDVEGFGEVDDVDEVVRDALAFFEGGFGCADVESAVDLHGVDGDDFAVEFLG